MPSPTWSDALCLICVEFQKQKMTIREARNAYREMVVTMTPEHAKEVQGMLSDAEKAKQQAEQASQAQAPKDPA